MKKALSILLSIILIATSFSTLFTLEAGAVATNLLGNGDLTDVSNFAINGKYFTVNGFTGNYNGVTATSSVAMVQDPTVPAAAKTSNNNVVQFTMDSNGTTGNATIYSTNTYTLKENTNYEMVYWVKTSELYGLKFYVYEPTCTSRLNTAFTSPGPAEGANIYSNSWTAGPDAANPPYWSQRVVRTDIYNTVRANNGFLETIATGIVNGTTAYSRNAPQADRDAGLADSRGYYDVTKKYAPSGLNNGWVRVSMSFKTKAGNWDGTTATCTANSTVYTDNGLRNIPYSVPVTLGISTCDQTSKLSTLSVAGFEMHEAYAVNASVDSASKGGIVSINGGTAGSTVTGSTNAGDTTTLTATAFYGNQFIGWYDSTGTTLLSNNTTYSYNPTADGTFIAKFTNNNLYPHPGFEDYANNLSLAVGGAPGTQVDGWHAGSSSWMWAKVVSTPVYSGSRALSIYNRNNDGLYYTFNVEANTVYTVNFKWYINAVWDSTNLTRVDNFTIGTAAATGANTASTALVQSGTKLANNQWNDQTLTFNSGTNTTVRFLVNHYSVNATDTKMQTLYLDDLAIFKTKKITVTTNNEGGVATATKLGALSGESVTFTAKPYECNTFNGWYKDGALYNSNPSFSEAITADTAYEARFTNRNLFPEAGFESLPTAQLFNNGNTLNTTWSGSASWGEGTVVTSSAYSGAKSLRVSERHNTSAKLITGLSTNTNYVFSMYYYISTQYNSGHAFNFAAVTIPGYTYLATSTGAVGEPDGVNVLGKTSPVTTTFGSWTRVAVPFNTGSNTSVKLHFRYASDAISGDAAYIYVDEMALYQTYVVTATKSGTGGVVTTPSVSVGAGSSATLTAVPNTGDTFLGWYLNGTKVSDNATYTTDAIAANTQYVAKFTSNTVAVNGTFENYANGTRLDNYKSTDPSGVAAASWHGQSTWYQNTQHFPSTNESWITATVANDKAHSGSNSLALGGMYQGYYSEISDILPNTLYTVSLYFWLPAWDATNVPSFGHISVVPGTSQVDYTGNQFNYPNVPAADKANFSTYNAADPNNDLFQAALAFSAPGTKGTGNWEQATISFNSGNNASVFLSIGYAALAGTGIKMYVDDITMIKAAESLPVCDADTDPGKIVNGGGTSTITETATTASDPAVLGSKVYSITTPANFTYIYTGNMVLKGGKRYDVSFYFKVADGHAMLTTEEASLQYVSFFIDSSIGAGGSNIPIQSNYTITREPVTGSKVTGISQITEFNVNKTAVVDGEGATMWQKITASFTPTTDTPAVLAIRPNAAGTVYVDKVKVTCAENAVSDVQAAINEVGTAIRTSGTQALRFKTSINKSAISNLYFGTYELVEYGSVAIRTAYLNGQELVDGSYTLADGSTIKNVGKGVAYIKDQKNVIFADTGDTIQFTGALTGISQTNYNTSYSLRAYAVLQRPDGSTFTIYDDATRSATIYSIANQAYAAPGGNNGYSEPPEVRDYLYSNIITKADFTTYPGDGFKHLN